MKKLSKYIVIAFTLFLIIIPPYLRCLYESSNLLSLARQQKEKGEIEKAITSYRKAVSWNSFFNADAETAGKELYALAVKEIFDRDLKIEALRELRSGLYSSRSFLVPQSRDDKTELLKQTETALAKFEGDRSKIRLRKKHKPRQNYLFQILSQIAFWAWVGFGIFTALKGFDREGNIIRSKLKPGLAGLAVCYLCWLVCLGFA